MKRTALLVFLLFAAPLPAAAQPLDWNGARQIVSLSQPRISPDGERVLFMRSRPDFEKDRRLSQLMIVNVKTHAMRALTFERTGVSDPQWSPDGSRVSFLAPGDREGASHAQTQIFVMRMDGGEAEQITQVENGVYN